MTVVSSRDGVDHPESSFTSDCKNHQESSTPMHQHDGYTGTKWYTYTHYRQGYERRPCRHIPVCMGTLKGSQGHLLLKDVSCPVWSPQSDACPRKDHCKTDPQRVTRSCKPVKEGRRRSQRGGTVDRLHNITPRDPPPSPSMCTHHTTGKGDFLPPALT